MCSENCANTNDSKFIIIPHYKFMPSDNKYLFSLSCIRIESISSVDFFINPYYKNNNDSYGHIEITYLKNEKMISETYIMLTEDIFLDRIMELCKLSINPHTNDVLSFIKTKKKWLVPSGNDFKYI